LLSTFTALHATGLPTCSEAASAGGLFHLNVLEQPTKQPHQFLLALTVLRKEVRDVDLVGVDAVTGPAHVTALFFMLDEQALSVGVEHQAPAVLVGAVAAL
jgi:hypothetical protein